ncbi:MAG: hypothetical protein E7Z92_06745 [Cyanobacteria bacterium SIG31]|nr:hypothetical protein [Cyanobacteria bacterium SIG31]
MAGIESISSGISNVTSRVLGAVSKSKPMKYITKSFQEHPETALALTTVGSIVVKDGVGCYKYVTQSLNNKEIPEDKRSFVAALDLTNGILMILAQIGMFFMMRKLSEPIFNRLFKGSFNAKNKGDMLSWLRSLAKKEGNSVIPRKIEAAEAYNKVRNDALSLFKFVADIGAATIIGKRIIVPFIATPLAGVVQKKMVAHQQKKQESSETNNVTDTKNVDDIKK